MALFLLLKFAQLCGLEDLQVFGDLGLVITTLNDVVQLHNLLIHPLADKIKDITRLFLHIQFSHIYRELNQITTISPKMVFNYRKILSSFKNIKMDRSRQLVSYHYMIFLLIISSFILMSKKP
jgi:hypothetical protein